MMLDREYVHYVKEITAGINNITCIINRYLHTHAQGTSPENVKNLRFTLDQLYSKLNKICKKEKPKNELSRNEGENAEVPNVEEEHVSDKVMFSAD